ncbi:hypothetical protein GMDG_08800 [Pseudogymnoascus destructans 20631-21]|uniref:Protein-S-isoprenylcysteine O-methyltransferase n=1 Tax=Pseudogymnoascus destructans (strain ATCC MYA-4855 / 20631-21) TaxID=658429 RepID=L8FP88_PSED2|nr:hypothetical protein GMDG_08800 [Pseudogymnoascus destructans 20631-21]
MLRDLSQERQATLDIMTNNHAPVRPSPVAHSLAASSARQNDPVAKLVGRGFGVAGIALLVWAAWTLRRHNTTIFPDKAATTLVTDGPFRYRRNPIYIADILILFGLAEISQNVWFALMAVPFALLVTWLAILPEERHLEDQFGDAYRDYKARTRRWI